MKDVFDRIYDEIVEAEGDLSRLYHALGSKIDASLCVTVAKMSDEDIIRHLSELGQKKLEEEGVTMNSVEFYKRVMVCKRRLRKEYPGVETH